MASAKLVNAASAVNQNEIMEAANSLRKAVVDVIHTGAGAVANATEVCCLCASVLVYKIGCIKG